MSLLTDDRGASPHERAATDIVHLLAPCVAVLIGGPWLNVWLAGFGLLQAIQLARAGWAKAAWRDALFDVAVTAAGAGLALAALGSLTTGLAITAGMGGLYTWRHRRAWGLAWWRGRQ